MLMAATTNKRRLLPSLMLGLLLSAAAAWLSTPNVSAHAAYESSMPAFAEVLTDSPTEISISFTQELFRRAGANTMTLRHEDSGATITLGQPEIGNDDRHLMRASVDETLSPGRYLVSWTNLSAEDGDADTGSFPFYLQREPTPAEVEWDRELAAELLIAYPGDEPQTPDSPASDAPAAPTVVRNESSETVALGAGPIIWLVVGALAALIVVGALGFHLGSRRRDV